MELNIKEFGQIITRLINKENLSKEEAYDAFSVVLRAETSDIQQGAFLAALSTKGETKDEIAGCWKAIYENDTVKATPNVEGLIVENCGTGMDSFKTFNISTCASLVAAAGGINIARHGARALTSTCGTVDIAEALGVDVESGVEIAVKSLEQTGLALFNGMSPKVHPMALGRILSQMSFGSTLNIAASLASPVIPDVGVRGVYSKDMIKPVAEVMQAIGYKRALIFNGQIDGEASSMDEASIAGTTHFAELCADGIIREYDLKPEELGIPTQNVEDIKTLGSIDQEKKRVVKLLKSGTRDAAFYAVAYNAGLIFYAAEKANSIKEGVQMASEILASGQAYERLVEWTQVQNLNPAEGKKILEAVSLN